MQLCSTAAIATACAGWKKKMYLCILMIHVCTKREKKNLVQFPIESSYEAPAAAIVLVEFFFFICVF